MAREHRGKATADIVVRRLKQFIGFDPLMTEHLWQAIWEVDRIEEFQVHALGLLDTACWDIKARKAGLPLYQLLGGYKEKIPAYASTVTWETMAEYERHIKTCLDEGFTAFKLHAWGDPIEDAKLARNLRQWAGDKADLMFDASAGWDYVTALKFGRILEDLNYLVYEEPMREFDLPSYTELCRALDIPVLAAETADGAGNPCKDILVICHGGPFDEPENVAKALAQMPGINGFFCASSIERLPTERAIRGQVEAFRAAKLA